MPAIVQGSPFGNDASSRDTLKKDLGYAYPQNLNLRPGSELHERIKNEVLERARASSNIMSNRFGSWNEIDRVLTTYIDLSVSEKAIKDADSRKPVSIVFPYTYAILETILSYLVTAFVQEPIFRYEGNSPEDTVGAILLEKVVEQHCSRFKVALGLHTWFRDSLTYGMGVVTPTWRQQRGSRLRKGSNAPEESGLLMGGPVEQPAREFDENVILYEGNALENVDPYLFLPDPNVAIHKVQDGEYVGWVSNDNYMNLLGLEGELEEELEYFNVRYLKALQHRRTSIYPEDGSQRQKKTGGQDPRMTPDRSTTPTDVIYMYIKLIPADWGLGDSERPEKWLFGLAADEVIIKAKPLGLSHNLYPVAIIAPDFDGYSSTPMSRIEVLYGLQGVLDWLFNSHIANVRKSLHDMFVVDPYMVNIKDLANPTEGGLIRLRRPVWGKGVQNAVQQLNVRDVTQQNIGDSSFIVNWMQKIAGADNPMMGSLRQGGPDRLSSAEFQGTAQGAVSRLERVARIIGIQGMQDLGLMFAYHTQQIMHEDVYVKATGEWEATLMKEFNVQPGSSMKVRPQDLLVGFDLKIRDGSIPGGNFSQAWLQLFEMVSRDPELREMFDTVRIFMHIARNLGAKNVEQFKRMPDIQTSVMGEGEIQRGVQQGNLAPTSEVFPG